MVGSQADQEIGVANSKAHSEVGGTQFGQRAGTAGTEPEGVQLLQQERVLEVGVPSTVAGAPKEIHRQSKGLLGRGSTNENTCDLWNFGCRIGRSSCGRAGTGSGKLIRRDSLPEGLYNISSGYGGSTGGKSGGRLKGIHFRLAAQ